MRLNILNKLLSNQTCWTCFTTFETGQLEFYIYGEKYLQSKTCIFYLSIYLSFSLWYYENGLLFIYYS